MSDYKVRELSEFTDEEKIAKFDAFYESAKDEWDYVNEHGHSSKAPEQYIFEDIMSLLAQVGGRKEFWIAYNKVNTGEGGH